MVIRLEDALAAGARCITGSIRRPADTAARYASEEFIVVLPNTPAAGASEIAEKILGVICSCGIEHERSEHGCLTASIGAVSGTPQSDDVIAVIRAADEALYNAKATGRNRVSLSRVP